MTLLCKHKERIENKDIFPSPWEMMNMDERKLILVNAMPWIFRKKIATTFICSKCGRRQTLEIQSMEGPA